MALHFYFTGENSKPSHRGHKPVSATVSAPLDDMALPSGCAITSTGSRRPLSYHPTTSCQMHCATAPRSRNYTTNYFESDAFRRQGHANQASEVASRRNRTSNSLCQEQLSTVSSEEESDSEDEEELDISEGGNEPTSAGSALFDSEPSQQNGHGAEAINSCTEISSAGDVDRTRGTSEQTGGTSFNQELSSEGEDSSQSARARLVSPLLWFSDPGLSFKDFIEQQNALSEERAEYSSEGASGSSVDNSEAASPVVVEQIPTENAKNRPSSEHETEISACVSTENDGIEALAEAAAASEEVVADASYQEESWDSSDASGSADDGGDSAERGYIEFEPGYVDGQSDTASQCSDVEEDDIYIGDDIPVETIEGTVLGGGDLLNECLDLLGAVGYTDLSSKDISNGSTEHAVENLQGVHSENSKSTEMNVNEASSVASSAAIASSSSPQIVASNCDKQPMSEEAPAVVTEVANDRNMQAARNISLVLDNGKLAKVLPSNSSDGLLEGKSVGEVQEISTGHSDKHYSKSNKDGQGIDIKDDMIVDIPLLLPSTERSRKLQDESHRAVEGSTSDSSHEVAGPSQKYRNRSYYKAMFESSADQESESKKLSKLNSELNHLLSPKTQSSIDLPKQLDNSQGEEAVSGRKNISGKVQNQDDLSKTSSPTEVTGVLSSCGPEASVVVGGGKSTVKNVVECTDSGDSAFALRHRILRDETSTVAALSSVPLGIDRHQITSRTDVANPNLSSRTKLRHSASDPLSSNHIALKMPLRERASDQVAVHASVPKSKFFSDGLVFRTDLPESSVDDAEMSSVDAATVSHLELGDSSSSSVKVDQTKLKEGRFKAMRETAILSSSEDLASGNSKNRPIGRSDQPILIQEIILPTATSAAAHGPQFTENRINLQNEEAAFAWIDVANRAPYDSQRKEKQMPPPVPRRNSSLECALQDGQSEGMQVKEPALKPEASKDPFINVTVRKERRLKNVSECIAMVDKSHRDASRTESRPDEFRPYEPDGRRPPHSSSSSMTTSSATQADAPSSRLLEKSGPNGLPNISHDPTGATKPRAVDRATAIKKTAKPEFSDPTSALLPSKGTRLRDIPNDVGNRPESVRVSEIEHKSRIRSPSEPAQPLSRNKHRSPSEPPELHSNESPVPPVIPPRSSRPNQISRARPDHSKVTSTVSMPSANSPNPNSKITSLTGSYATPHPRAEAQRPVSSDNSSDRRDNGAVTRASRSKEGAQITARSPAILHSDTQSSRSNDTNSRKPEAHQVINNENDDILPPRK